MQTSLQDLLLKAFDLGASSLLLLPGQQPVCRIGRALQPPLSDDILTPEETRRFSEPLMHDAMLATLETDGSVEAPFLVGAISGQVTIFLGQGSHHLVFHLDAPESR